MAYVFSNTLMESTYKELSPYQWSDRLDGLTLWGLLIRHHEIYGNDPSTRRNIFWGKFFKRIDTHPHESTEERSTVENWIFPPEGRYPIHEALELGAPAKIIQKLVTTINENRSGIIRSHSERFNTPLHIACRAACIHGRFPSIRDSSYTSEILKILIDSDPKALMIQDQNGNIPLHHLSTYRFPRWKENIDLLLSECRNHFDPSLVGGLIIKNNSEVSPLDLICNRLLHRGCSIEAWSWFSNLLIRSASHFGASNIEMKVPLLHAAIRLSCTEKMIHQIVTKYPEYLELTDDSERLPLVEALCNKSTTSRMVLFLLESYKKGASHVDKTGKLPLHHAALRPRTHHSILDQLIRAFPVALETCDNSECLYPFMFAPVACTDNTAVAFQLLRANPAILAECIEEK